MRNTEVTQAERDALTNDMQAAGTAQPVDLLLGMPDASRQAELHALFELSMINFIRDLQSDLLAGDHKHALKRMNEFLRCQPDESRRNVVFISGYDQDGKRVAVKSVAARQPLLSVDVADMAARLIDDPQLKSATLAGYMSCTKIAGPRPVVPAKP